MRTFPRLLINMSLPGLLIKITALLRVFLSLWCVLPLLTSLCIQDLSLFCQACSTCLPSRRLLINLIPGAHRTSPCTSWKSLCSRHWSPHTVAPHFTCDSGFWRKFFFPEEMAWDVTQLRFRLQERTLQKKNLVTQEAKSMQKEVMGSPGNSLWGGVSQRCTLKTSIRCWEAEQKWPGLEGAEGWLLTPVSAMNIQAGGLRGVGGVEGGWLVPSAPVFTLMIFSSWIFFFLVFFPSKFFFLPWIQRTANHWEWPCLHIFSGLSV